ncbi:GTP:adenosylcobinamide-phosphate guanylyltransferase [Caldisphaera lagunensis DSM 15908]|uniref:GTP:adenosylcobinamide-phosphate guanylyltransferase n=1 Tax=Caldisphaera lagunensis (strain DSM 15908 / JCM 11604 / ANMR 0165 / IC-154) TaxID=1056495 RepID=L0AAA9_CALLD|nr:GTP--adenosylcobinamide-phosphate guanylyltransferase [Caldisphaera lagunensis]AFZ70843.1 GTP:adenosylcobinamide-phosphate guanylyltransferase [Caldisphaera lagunensis DSM 15908]
MVFDADIAIIMAGGKGKRFGSSFKPFIEICGKPMIFNIIDKTKKLFKFNIIAISENVENFLYILKNKYKDLLLIYTTGIDYSIDLKIVLDMIKKRPIIVFPSDIPFIKENTIEEIILLSRGMNEDLITILNKQGEPVGISIIKGNDLNRWTNLKLNEDLININTKDDLNNAKVICND